MADSPASFRDGEDIDLEILASRLPASSFDATTLADLLRVPAVSLWTMVTRGLIPRPDHYESVTGNRDRAIWRAEQLVAAGIGR